MRYEQCSPLHCSPGWLPFRAGLCQRDPAPWTGRESPQGPQSHQLPTSQTRRQAWTADILSSLDGRQAFWIHSIKQKRTMQCGWYQGINSKVNMQVVVKGLIRLVSYVLFGRVDCDAWVNALVRPVSLIFTSVGSCLGPGQRPSYCANVKCYTLAALCNML